MLVDGNAIVHRAYHALPPLHKKDGKLTNAVYGFFAMTLKIVSDLNPEALIVCFDRAAPTFRKQLYVGYQATRPKMEDDLSFQFGLIHETLEKIKVCVFELDGYEADDLIGTLACQAAEDGRKLKVEGRALKIENRRSIYHQSSTLKNPSSTVHHPSSSPMFDQVIILTGDRDLLQLVNERVLILAPITGVTKMILFDSDKVKEKYGLNPSQIVDYKALVGDSSDNYPGVAGIGPKTASDLLNKYQTLEGIYENLGEINPKTAEKLAKDAEQSAMAKKLATIELNAPIHLKFSDCDLKNLDRKALLKEFQDLNFNSLIDRFKLDKKQKEPPAQRASGPEGKKQKELKDQLNLL
ncbi:MAG: hypothetical protein A3A51_00685 [Candidatus Levybacteria bacterium RIFCSPLOWO2_01_FULL_39_10]|nr:MAG: hypothetical protein A3A51_00685 [Candidatus Levybacteria bacterium RIFCSPLOWO2_01_FULL_39_10]